MESFWRSKQIFTSLSNHISFDNVETYYFWLTIKRLFYNFVLTFSILLVDTNLIVNAGISVSRIMYKFRLNWTYSFLNDFDLNVLKFLVCKWFSLTLPFYDLPKIINQAWRNKKFCCMSILGIFLRKCGRYSPTVSVSYRGVRWMRLWSQSCLDILLCSLC